MLPAELPASGQAASRSERFVPPKSPLRFVGGLCLAGLVVGVGVLLLPTTSGATDAHRLELIEETRRAPRVGSVRPVGLPVRVQDPEGKPEAGKTVVFSLIRGDGILSGTRTDPGDTRVLATTDDTGRTLVFYRPGPRSGTVSVRVHVPELDLTGVHAFRVRPGRAVRLARVGGDGQRVLYGREVPEPMVVEVRDTYGNPVPGREVRFHNGTEGAVLDVNAESEGIQSVGVSDHRGRVAVDLYRVSSTQTRNEVEARLVGNGGGAASTVRFRIHGQPRLISLDFREATLPAVLRSLAEASDWNLVLPDEVDDRPLAEVTLSVRLEDVPALRALDTILDQAGLARVVNGNIMRIVEGERNRSSPGSIRAPWMTSGVVPLRYRRAGSVVSTLKRMQEDGAGEGLELNVSFAADESTNSVIFTGPASSAKKVRELIGRLDERQKQVLIRGLILEYSLNKGMQVNPEFFVNPRGNQVTGAGDFTGRGGVALNAVDAALDQLGQGAFTALLNETDFQAVINILADSTRSEILSKPQITAINNEEASIRVGSEQEVIVSRQTSEGLQTSLETIEAFTELNVTPTVTRGGHVQMDLVISSDDFLTGEVPENVVSQINRRRTENTVLVEDGQTLVIGGLIERTERDSKQGVPYLKDLPLLGVLFRSSSVSDRKSELLVFLTPRVIRSDTEGRFVSRAAADAASGVTRPAGLSGRTPGTETRNLNRAAGRDLTGPLDRDRFHRVLRERDRNGYYRSWDALGRRVSLAENDILLLQRHFQLSIPRHDLNHADRPTLLRIPGVDERLARDIVDYRSTSDGFRSVEDLRELPGIDASRFATLRQYLHVGRPDTSDPIDRKSSSDPTVE